MTSKLLPCADCEEVPKVEPRISDGLWICPNCLARRRDYFGWNDTMAGALYEKGMLQLTSKHDIGRHNSALLKREDQLMEEMIALRENLNEMKKDRNVAREEYEHLHSHIPVELAPKIIHDRAFGELEVSLPSRINELVKKAEENYGPSRDLVQRVEELKTKNQWYDEVQEKQEKRNKELSCELTVRIDEVRQALLKQGELEMNKGVLSTQVTMTKQALEEQRAHSGDVERRVLSLQDTVVARRNEYRKLHDHIPEGLVTRHVPGSIGKDTELELPLPLRIIELVNLCGKLQTELEGLRALKRRCEAMSGSPITADLGPGNE